MKTILAHDRATRIGDKAKHPQLQSGCPKSPFKIYLRLVPATIHTGATTRFCGPQGENVMALKKFMIERDIPKVGALDAEQLSGAATKSNEALCNIGAKDIQWVHSYVTADKTFCVYLASNEAAIQRHAEMSGFPANKITEIVETIDPATAK
jgi:hypothetical protein